MTRRKGSYHGKNRNNRLVAGVIVAFVALAMAGGLAFYYGGAPSAGNTGSSAGSSFGSLVDAGNRAFDAQRYEQAIKYYEQVLKLQPGNLPVMVDLGTSYFYKRQSEPQKAIELYDRAISINPAFLNAWFNKGVVLSRTGADPALVRAAWQEVIRLAPDSEQAKVAREKLAEMEPRPSEKKAGPLSSGFGGVE